MNKSSQSMLFGLLLCSIWQVSAWADGFDKEIRFDIAPQSLASAVLHFAEQSKIQVVTSSGELERFKTQGLKGDYSVRAGLNALLDGTGLTYQEVGSGTVSIGRSAVTTRSDMASGASAAASVRLAQNEAPPPETAPSGDAAAQEAGGDTQLEEILVTAQKRVERLQDVPLSVSAINAETLALNGQTRIEEYYRKVPGLNLAVFGNGNSPTASFRGITLGGSTNPTVGIIVDDVPFGATVSPGMSPIVPNIDPGDLARIEVLRGPQGTLYGAASLSGLLKYVTVDPSTDRFSGRLQAGASSVKNGGTGYNVRGSANVPLSDAVALRVSAFSTEEPGYVDNVLTGQDDLNHTRTNGGRLSALWKASEDFSLRVSAMVQDAKRPGPAAYDITRGENPNGIWARNTGLFNQKAEAYSAIVNGRVGSADWTSVSGYSIDDYLSGSDFSGLCGFLQCADHDGVTGAIAKLGTEVEKFSQEVRASIPFGSKFSWRVGAFYSAEDARTILDLQAQDPLTGVQTGATATDDQRSSIDERALFTDLTVQFTPRFDVQVGGRYSENKQQYAFDVGGPIGPLIFSPVPKFDLDDDSAAYLLAPRFKLSPDLMIYARVASGFRPGAPNTLCGSVPCTYKPDKTENYELGLKGTALDRKVTFESSIYYIDWTDVQIPLAFPLTPTFSLGYTGNGSRATSQGVELSLEVRPIRGMTISSWVAWNDAELAEDLPANSSADGQEGDRLPYSSRFSGNLSLDQEFPLSASMNGFVGASVSYVDDRLDVFQAPGFSRPVFPSYTQVDVHGGVRFGSWLFNAYVNNVTNRRGLLSSSFPLSFIVTTQPRMFGASLTKTFE